MIQVYRLRELFKPFHMVYRSYNGILSPASLREVWTFPISKVKQFLISKQLPAKQFPIIDETVSHPFWPRSSRAIDLFLLSSAIEWALETCTFLSQNFEISLNLLVQKDLWRPWRALFGLWGVNRGVEPLGRHVDGSQSLQRRKLVLPQQS